MFNIHRNAAGLVACGYGGEERLMRSEGCCNQECIGWKVLSMSSSTPWDDMVGVLALEPEARASS